jgi:hypothetical protein
MSSATVPIEQYSVSVWSCVGHPTQRDQQFGDEVDRKFYREYPQLNLHAHGPRAAGSETCFKIMDFGFGRVFCLSNSQMIFWLITHFRTLNITMDICIVFSRDSLYQWPNKYLKIPRNASTPIFNPQTQIALNTQSPNTFCSHQTIPLTQSALKKSP